MKFPLRVPGAEAQCLLLLAANAPITSVGAQLGHANPSTTLRYYARWIPNKGRRWADLLDRVTDFVGSKLGTKKWNQNEIGHSGAPEVADLIGGPSRTRTVDPLIKSLRAGSPTVYDGPRKAS